MKYMDSVEQFGPRMADGAGHRDCRHDFSALFEMDPAALVCRPLTTQIWRSSTGIP